MLDPSVFEALRAIMLAGGISALALVAYVCVTSNRNKGE